MNGGLQKQDVSRFTFTIAGGVLTVVTQKGPGVLTRVGAGILRVTYPAGASIDTARHSLHYTGMNAVMVNAQLDITSTDTVKTVFLFDNAGMAIDNTAGEIVISQYLGD